MLFRECAETFNELEGISGRLEMTDILAELFKKVPTNEIQPLIYIIQGILAPPYEDIDIGLGEKFAIKAISSSTGHPQNKIEKHSSTHSRAF